MRADFKLTRERPVCYCKAGDAAVRKILTEQVDLIQTIGQSGDFLVSGMDGKLPEDLVSNILRGDLEVFMTPPKVDHGEQLKKLEKDLAPKIKVCNQLKQKLGKAVDFDAKGLKKMEKNEKKLAQACEKFGLATGSLPEMCASLTKLLTLQSENPADPAYAAAIAAASAVAQSKVGNVRVQMLAEIHVQMHELHLCDKPRCV